jgi:hypothetical protein
MSSDDPERPEISDEELRLRIVYSLFGPVAMLAKRFMLPLKQLVSFFEMACYHELKRASLTLDESAERLDVSRRKVAQLSKQLKQNFFRPEYEHGLPRRIEYMLWAGPMTEGRIKQALDEHDDETVDEALDTLAEQDRVEVDDSSHTTRYAVPDSSFRLYEDDWMARIDGLNNLLSNLADTVVGRFFEEDDRSFARTLNFRLREEDVERLREMYEEDIFQTLAELEKRTEREDVDDEEVVDMSLSTLWAPRGLADEDDDDSN